MEWGSAHPGEPKPRVERRQLFTKIHRVEVEIGASGGSAMAFDRLHQEPPQAFALPLRIDREQTEIAT